MVRGLRGRRPRRRRGQVRRRALPAQQAGDGEGQARPHRRLRGRRLPGAQVRARPDRLAAARALRRPGRPNGAGRDAGVDERLAAHPGRGSRAFPMARRIELFEELQPLVTTFDDHPWAWAGAVTDAAAGSGRGYGAGGTRQGPDVRAAAPGAGPRGALRAHGRAPVPPHGAVRALAAGPVAGVVHLPTSSTSRCASTSRRCSGFIPDDRQGSKTGGPARASPDIDALPSAEASNA